MKLNDSNSNSGHFKLVGHSREAVSLMSVHWKITGALSLLTLLAAICFVRTTQPSPDQAFRIGMDALNRGDWKVVSRQIESLRKQPTEADRLRVLRGGLLLRTGDIASALRELSRVPTTSDHKEQAALFVCEALYSAKRWSDAEAFAQEVLAKNPDQADAHRWLGAIYYDLGVMAEAEHHLTRLSQLTPLDYSPHRMLGLIHKDFERFNEAIADYQKALERHPPQTIRWEILYELAQSQVRLNDFTSALKTLDVPLAREEVQMQVLRAECLWSLDRKTEAQKVLHDVQFSHSVVPVVLQLAARFALDEGRTADAIRTLEKLVTVEPFNHQALFDLSSAFRRVGNDEKANDMLKRRDVAYSLTLRMVELNKQAIQQPNNVALREELAEVCEQLGKSELATVWRQAADSLRNSPTVQLLK